MWVFPITSSSKYAVNLVYMLLVYGAVSVAWVALGALSDITVKS